jgi:hypothetical protein
MSNPFVFPNPVNEKVARSVATLVLGLALIILATRAWWLLAPMSVGFALRVAFGPRVSPFAVFASRVVAPRAGQPRLTPGPPKRFAQAIGLLVTGVGAVAWLGYGNAGVAGALTVLIAVAASLEAGLGLCIGCRMFALLMRVGLIPRSICLSCARGPAQVF